MCYLLPKSQPLKELRTSDAFWVSFGVCAELGIGDQWAGGVTVAGGGVGDILGVGEGTSGSGVGCSIRLSGFV